MWLAYDAQTCGLARIWKGGVKLQGAVEPYFRDAPPSADAD